MSVTTLFSDGECWVASTRLVYTAAERGELESAAEQAWRLDELVSGREAALEEAREAGRVAGFERGRREAAERSAVELGEALAALRDEVAAERRGRREAVVELALALVRRLAGDVVEPERLAALARVAAVGLVDESRLLLHVHPSLVATLDPHLAPETGAPALDRNGRRSHPFDAVVGDDTLAPDGASIETPGGRIAIDLDTQLEAVREQLLGRADVLELLERDTGAVAGKDAAGDMA